MCMYICKHMTSKNISITEDVYKKLIKIKKNDESFSELFLRLLKNQKVKIEKCFGAWNLSKEELSGNWDDITRRPGRNWSKTDLVN